MSDSELPGFPNQCVWYLPAPWRRPSDAARFCCAAMRRDDGFDALEARGFDNPLEISAADLPPEFLTAA